MFFWQKETCPAVKMNVEIIKRKRYKVCIQIKITRENKFYEICE